MGRCLTMLHIKVVISEQKMYCFQGKHLEKTCMVSTALNGPGEQNGSGCTPRGKHRIYSKIGTSALVNAVFISRQWTGEVWTPELAKQYPGRDWIITRILQLEGLEPGYNAGGEVDSLKRYIYIHGTPYVESLGTPGSKGCIRMANQDIIWLTDWVDIGTEVYII